MHAIYIINNEEFKNELQVLLQVYFVGVAATSSGIPCHADVRTERKRKIFPLTQELDN